MIPISRTALVLLASGRSRRFGRRDKLTQDLGGQPLLAHAARVLADMKPLVRIAVCPTDRPAIGEMLNDRFVIGLNRRPAEGFGRSIAVGVDVALKFKPDAIVLCLADMPFVEAHFIEDLLRVIEPNGPQIVHAGSRVQASPPTAFAAACFDDLLALKGDDGARPLVRSGRYRVVARDAPSPLLLDVDTRDDLDIARAQLAIRERYAQRAPAPRKSAA